MLAFAICAKHSYHLSWYAGKVLHLNNNQLSGTVPYMPNLLVLDVASNQFTEPRFDAVPAALQLLYAANNSLSGNMVQLGTRSLSVLKLLDLSYNHLSGSLPQVMPSDLSILNVSNNAFAGSLPSSWSILQNVAEVRLDNNQFTGTLPSAWSAWGSNTANSLQLSITNSSLHGRVPRQWVEQYCLAIVKNGSARVLFEPIDNPLPTFYPNADPWGPLIELPAQHASIKVTLATKLYIFDYDNPDSVCGIPQAARNTALLWGTFGALLVSTLVCICLWQRRKPKPGHQSGWFRHCRISTVLRHDNVHFGRQVANRVWFLVSDVGWTIYSQVTDAVTIHQVVVSKQLVYAYILLAILLVPFAFMFILVARVSINRCRAKAGFGTLMNLVAAPLMGLLLAPVLFCGLHLVLIFHGIGVPLPAWWGPLGVDLGSFYRTQSLAEAFLSALPQSIVQTKLYLMGNDPNGVHVYIDTSLFLVSMTGLLSSVLKTVALIVIELHQYGISLVVYGLALVQFDSFTSLPWTPIT